VEQRFLEYVQELGITARTKILLAVSGGLDSMVMLHLFYNLKFEVSVAHVNFKLRGVESDGDAKFVKDWCTDHQIPFFVTHFETNNYAIEKGLSIQMAARELRYNWFNELMAEHQFSFVATAHHLNDSLETALLNLARGSGLEGLTGIAPLSGNRVRPLLFATRADIETYAAENEIAWREDSSNQTDAYQRNVIRHKIIPELKRINPALEAGFKSMVAKVQSDLSILHLDVQQWREKYVEVGGDLIKIRKAGLSHSSDLPRLWRTVRNFGFSWEQAEAIHTATPGQSGKIFYSATHCLAVDRETLIISKLIESLPIVSVPVVSGKFQLGLDKIELEVPITPEVIRDAGVAVVDFDKLAPTLVWRTWQAGDSFFPLGMKQHKKVSDFLIDEKVPVNLKSRVTVLESKGEIVWVVGYRIDDRYKLTATTRQAARFRVTQS
jgi:tRNA(Ile)-lysidine synthase